MSASPTEHLDKSTWGYGPWQTEPDHVEFRHLGFPCIVHRVESHGGLCGYVAVPPGHPWHGVDFSSWEHDGGPSVHGGVTYADKCFGKICHIPAPGEPDDVWWLGFDMAHAGDLSPATMRYWATKDLSIPGEQYRTVEYVKSECESVAQQAALAAAEVLP